MSRASSNESIVAVAQLTAYFKVDEGETFMWSRKLSPLGLTLLTRAIDRAIDTFAPGRLSFAEFLTIVKTCREELLEEHPYEPCTECEYTPGWIERADTAGIERAVRCECWKRWKDGLERIIGQLSAPPSRSGRSSSVAQLASDLHSAKTPEQLNAKVALFKKRMGTRQ